MGGAARFYCPVTIAPDGLGWLYVIDQGNSMLRKVSLSTGMVTSVLGVPGQKGVKIGAMPGGLNAPTGVAVDTAHNLYLSDNQEGSLLIVH